MKPGALRELGPLNSLLAHDGAFRQIQVSRDETGDHFELQMTRHWRTAESLLLPIAENLAQFICEENFSDIKACEGTSCTLMFADHTRRRARRWCSMAICGNRAKQAAHRERLRSQN